MPDTYLAEPAIHPRWRDSSHLRELGAQFSRRGWLRLEPALEPALAAEVALVLAQLPLGLNLQGGRAELCWGSIVEVPEQVDPQHPEPIFRLFRLLSRDVPELVGHITGRRWRTKSPRHIGVRSYRKGCYREATAPAAGMIAELGLTRGTWPEGYGGHLELVDGSGAVIERLAPAWDTLDLIDARLSVAMPMIQRSVEVLSIRALVEEA